MPVGRALASVFAASALLAACAAPQPATTPAAGTGARPAATTDPVTARPLATDRWTTLRGARVALTEVAAAPLRDRIWVAGGLASDGGAVDLVQVYDVATDRWSEGPRLPAPIHHAALVSDGRELYLLGGYEGSGFGSPTRAVRRLDPARARWEDGPPLPEARAAGAAAWDGTRILYAGGVGPAGVSDAVFVLDGGAWRPSGRLSAAREHLAAASDGGGRTWFLGGRTSGLGTNLGVVDRVEGERAAAVSVGLTPRGGVAGFWSTPHGACLVGGEGPAGTFADVECIDRDGRVVRLPSLTEARHGLGAAVVRDVAYVLLGGPQPGLHVSGTVEALGLNGR